MTPILLLIVLMAQAPRPAQPPPGLAELQTRASAAHRAYRERVRSAQRCDPQTATSASSATRAAIEASQRRRQVIAAMAKPAVQPDSAQAPLDPTEGELSRAVGLLNRDLELSDRMLAAMNSAPGGADKPFREALVEAATLPSIQAPAEPASPAASEAASIVSVLTGDLSTEESLLNSYFNGSKGEVGRVCMEKALGADDPFRVPAKPAKPAPKKKAK